MTLADVAALMLGFVRWPGGLPRTSGAIFRPAAPMGTTQFRKARHGLARSSATPSVVPRAQVVGVLIADADQAVPFILLHGHLLPHHLGHRHRSHLAS